jgi:hypothetical protein
LKKTDAMPLPKKASAAHAAIRSRDSENHPRQIEGLPGKMLSHGRQLGVIDGEVKPE